MKKIRTTRAFPWLFGLAFLAVSLAACDWVEDDEEEHHDEIVGVVLRMNGSDLVTVRNPDQVTGSITVTEGAETDHIQLLFLTEDDDRVDPATLDPAEFGLGWEFEDPSVANLVQDEGDLWDFHIHGEQVGTTALRLKLEHGAPGNRHPDFTSAAIPVEVTAAGS